VITQNNCTSAHHQKQSNRWSLYRKRKQEFYPHFEKHLAILQPKVNTWLRQTQNARNSAALFSFVAYAQSYSISVPLAPARANAAVV
jgi:hypothetical protein